MRRETFVNNAVGVLATAMSAVDTSAVLVDGSAFPAEGDYRIVVGQELMLVTSRSTNTLTVERGIESSPAATHDVGDSVRVILTKGSLENYQKENTWSGNQSFPLRVYNLSNGAPGVVSDFTWVNQGGATAVDRDGRIVLMTPSDTVVNIRALVQTAPTPPYEIILAFSMVGQRQNSLQFGLTFRESSTGKFMAILRRCTDTLEISKYTSPTALSSTVFAQSWQYGSSVAWFKIEDDNTDLKFYSGPNGQDWIQIATEGRTVFMAGGPDEVGFFGNPDGTSSNDMLAEVYAFGEV